MAAKKKTRKGAAAAKQAGAEPLDGCGTGCLNLLVPGRRSPEREYFLLLREIVYATVFTFVAINVEDWLHHRAYSIGAWILAGFCDLCLALRAFELLAGRVRKISRSLKKRS